MAIRWCLSKTPRRSPRRRASPVQIDYEAWEDLRPKTAVAANVGSGPDIVLAWLDDPQQYPDKLVDLTDIADYLGQKYGGWH